MEAGEEFIEEAELMRVREKRRRNEYDQNALHTGVKLSKNQFNCKMLQTIYLQR